MAAIKSPKQWLIYTLKNPRTDEVRYVGVTSKSLERRLREHIKSSITVPNSHRAKWILSLVSIGLIPHIESIEQGSGAGWAEAERQWISSLLANGARLVNATAGGEGGSDSKHRQIWWSKLTPERRGAIISKMQSACTYEHRIANIRKAHAVFASMTAAQRSALIAANWAKKTAEERRAIGKKTRIAERTKAMTPEMLKARARKCADAKTSETKKATASIAGKASAAVRTFDERSNSAKKPWVVKTSEQRSVDMKKIWANKTPEEISEARRKGWATVPPERRTEIAKATQARLTPEERRAAGAKRIANSSFEKRSASAKLRWAQMTDEKKLLINAKIGLAIKRSLALKTAEERSATAKRGAQKISAEALSVRGRKGANALWAARKEKP